MRKLTVTTGWSPSGYNEYGKRFVESFAKYWPEDVDLIVYGEEYVDLPRGEFRLLSSIDGCMEFIRRSDNLIHRGRVRDKRLPPWKQKFVAEGYNYKFDAHKFCRQCFIPNAASESLSGDGLLCWLDADVVTFNRVPSGFIQSLLPQGRDVAYLGRGDKHSEIGFQLYDLSTTREVLRDFSDYYSSDKVFSLKEWHSAYVFDTVRRKHSGVVRYHDMTIGGTGHVWFQSPLCRYLDHLKGNRKAVGTSIERRAV